MQQLIDLAPTLGPAIVIVVAAMILSREMRRIRANGAPDSEKMKKTLEEALKRRDSLRPPAVEPADLRALHDRQEAQSLRLQDHAVKLAETADDVRELKGEVREIKLSQAETGRDVKTILEHLTK